MGKRLIVLCLVVFFLMAVTQPILSPDKPEPKRIIFTAEYAECAERFFIINLFYSATSALSAVEKIFCQEMARFQGLIISVQAGSDEPPSAEDVLEAHQKLLKRYGFEERDKREIYEEEGRRYSYGEKEWEEEEKSESGRERISFFDWLKGLSLPLVLIIVAILIILFYFMFRGVPGFFRKSMDTSSQQETAVKGRENRDEEIKTGDRGYHMALELAKKGEYGKALILLHKASVKKLWENHWIPPGKNYTNNDIRGLIKDTGQGMRIFTPFSQLAVAAERAAFRRENPSEETYAKLRQMYETTFLKMWARDRY